MGELWFVRGDKEYLDAVHRCYNDLAHYFRQETRYKYVNLLSHQIRQCIFRPSSRLLQRYSSEEEVSHWFREMERVGDDVKIAGSISKEEVLEAWNAMMFRACCWGACHYIVSGESAPATYYGSQVPVYIG